MAGRRPVTMFVAILVTATVVATAPAVAAPDTDSTVTRISLAENGTATWEVQIRTRLPTEADVDDYERFQEEFRENTSAYLDPFRSRMRGVVRQSANATGRPMEARDFAAETNIQSIPRRWGVVTYEFTWVHFAAHDGEAVTVGDVFDGQFYLTANDTFQVAGPHGYAVESVDPEPAERETGVVRWFGERAFDDERPHVRFAPQEPPTTDRTDDSGTTPAGGDGSGETTDGPNSGPGGTDARDGQAETTVSSDGGATGADILAAVVALLVGIAAVGGYRYYRQSGGTDGKSGRAGDAGSGVSAHGTDSSTGEQAGQEISPDADTAGADAANTGSVEPQSDSPNDDSAGIDPSPVLSDAERVEQVLADHDGQLRQSDIVEALDWSKSKTSRVLSDMSDAGRVEKLRIGRENIISLEESADGTDGAN